MSEADTRVISRDDLRRLQLEYANLLSSNLSQQEILAINAFYRTPAGEKWMSVHAGIDRAVADRLALQIGAAACRIYLVQRDAHQAQEPAGEAPSRRQIEKVITANEQYCHCAAAPFARSLMVGDAAGRDKLLDDVRSSGQCGSPAE